MKLKRGLEKRDILNIAVLLVLAGLFIWIGFEYNKVFGRINGGDLVSSAENLREFVLSHGGAGIWIMIALQILQTIVSVIPAAIVQFAGGAIYGIGGGMLIGIAGVAVGTAITFYISRLFGRRIVTLFVSEESLAKLEGILSKDTSSIALLLLYVIPFPKDFIAYFIGLTKMKASKLFIISALGRLPGMFVSSYLGANIFERNYALLIIVSAVVVVSFVLAYVFRSKLMALISRK